MYQAPRFNNFFMLNFTEDFILTAFKNLNAKKIKTFLAFKFSDVVVIMLINVKIQTIVGILTFMSMIYFMLN